MKVGILTHHLGTNYGGVLQNYALQQVLLSLGCTPITLNHIPANPYTLPKKIRSILKQILRNLQGKKENLRVWTTASERSIITQNIAKFVDARIVKTEPFKLADLSHHKPNGLDAIIVGSDQVWNPKYIKPIEQFFLSDFVDCDLIKIAYAASFGGAKWDNNKKKEFCSILANQFDLITVREDTGVTMCNELFHLAATQVLDPTMLLSHSHYRSLLPNERNHKTDSLLAYILDNTLEKKQMVEIISTKMRLEINSVMPKSTFRKVGPKGIEECVYPSIETWIQGFEDADFVVTDSFHGTVFAIIFNKPFITIVNRRRGADRFTSLLNLFGLGCRLIDVEDDFLMLLDEKIDYARVNGMIRDKKEESISLLRKALHHDS